MYSADIEGDFLFGLCSMADSARELADMLIGLSAYGNPGRRHAAIRTDAIVRIEWAYPFDSNGLRHDMQHRLEGVDFAVSGASCPFHGSKTRTHGGHDDLDCLMVCTGGARVDLAKDTDAIVVQRGKDPIWIGWYRWAGTECILWHSRREAIEAVTSRCGCLFDERLQMWLVPENTGAAVVLASRSVVTWPC